MMTQQRSYKWVILMILALVCLLYAFGLWFIEKTLFLRCIFLFIIGGLALVVSFLSAIYSKAPRAGNIYRKHFYVAFLIGLWLLWLVIFNVLGSYYDMRYDVTEFNQHTMSQNTKSLLENLKQNIQITVLYVGIVPKYVEDLLNSYQKASLGRIRFEIVDPLQNIGYAARFGHVITGQQKKIIVESDKERQDVDFSETPLDEELLNNAIIRVTRKERIVYFLTGHQEYNVYDTSENGLSTFASLLQENNIVVRRLLLDPQIGIPLDCDVLVIAGTRDFLSEKEEAVIDGYLKKGGDALFLIENTIVSTPDKPLTPKEKEKNPSLNNILNAWGLQVAFDVVVDLASHMSGDVGTPATRNYMAHKAIVGNLDYTFYVRPRSLSVLKDRRPTIKLAPLVLTASGADKSWGEADRYLKVKYDEKEDRPGPVPIAYVVWEAQKDVSEKVSDTRMVVVTDADFLSNAFIDQYSNAQLGINAIHWLSEMDYKPFMGTKHIDVVKLNLTSKQKRVVAFILFVIPFSIVAVGAMIFLAQK